METEEWRDIPDYEGLYQVSNWGRIKSLNYNHTKKEQILALKTTHSGYLIIGLCKNGIRKFFSVHQLVALIFIPNDNPTEKTQVNHLDENKQNNYIYNLCWVTPKENINWGSRNKRVSEKNKGENHYLYGKHLSEETKQKISETLKGENNPFYGKHHTEETKKKISESKKNKYLEV